jgi:hypothetical protein
MIALLLSILAMLLGSDAHGAHGADAARALPPAVPAAQSETLLRVTPQTGHPLAG